MLPFSRDEAAAIQLMDLLKRKKATLDTYDDVMKWHLQFKEEDDSQRHKPVLSRKKMIAMLAKCYHFPKELVYHRQIVLPHSGAKVNIIYNDARELTVSLLTDPRFGDDNWLHFDDDPLKPLPEDLAYLQDINTGRCYMETYKQVITNPKQQMLVPILFYMDDAVMGQFDKLEVEQLKFTLGILNEKARKKEYAWRSLGSVPNYTEAESRGRRLLEETHHAAAHLMVVDEQEGIAGNIGSDDDQNANNQYESEKEYEVWDNKAQDLHRILAAILKTYREMEEEGMVWDYKFGGQLYKNVELKFFVAFVKCDTQEADKLCGSYTSHTKKVAQLCRNCCCPTDESDRVTAKYPLKTVAMIQRLVDREEGERLIAISQQCNKNAMYDLQLASIMGKASMAPHQWSSFITYCLALTY